MTDRLARPTWHQTFTAALGPFRIQYLSTNHLLYSLVYIFMELKVCGTLVSFSMAQYLGFPEPRFAKYRHPN
jgi:hypothetical protein